MPKRKPDAKSTQHEFVECDLEFPGIVEELSALEKAEADQVLKTVEKIEQMTWQQIYNTSSKHQKRGLNWEPLVKQRTASGKPIASIRLSDKFRARVIRDGVFMRFISLHPDHDSAYRKSGGEDV